MQSRSIAGSKVLVGFPDNSHLHCFFNFSQAYTIDPKLKIKYSGHVVNLHTDYPSTLLEMQKKVEDFLGVKFNHIMLNRYLSGEEYIGRHRDTKENNVRITTNILLCLLKLSSALSSQKIIASLSLGAERTFIMTPNKALPGVTKYSWKLTNGSLLVMGDGVQENWKVRADLKLNKSI